MNAHREAAQFNEIVTGRPASAWPQPSARRPARYNLLHYLSLTKGRGPSWDRSPKWSQFRSTGRQRAWSLDRAGRNRRVRPRRSARCEQRGVQSNQESGVAKLGTDGPVRPSSSARVAWWIGPPPIPRRGPPRATNRMTRPPRRSPPQEAARGFWIRAWGQREPALRGTGRSNAPARSPGSFEGGLDVPCPSRPMPFAAHRTPDPDVDVPRFGHSSVESGSLSFMR